MGLTFDQETVQRIVHAVREVEAQPQLEPTYRRRSRAGGTIIYDAKVTGWEEPGHRWFTGRRIDVEENELDPEDIVIYVRTYPHKDGDLEWHFLQPGIEGIREGSNNVIEVRQKLMKIDGEVRLAWICTEGFQLACEPPGNSQAAQPPIAEADIEEQQRRLTGGRDCCD